MRSPCEGGWFVFCSGLYEAGATRVEVRLIEAGTGEAGSVFNKNSWLFRSDQRTSASRALRPASPSRARYERNFSAPAAVGVRAYTARNSVSILPASSRNGEFATATSVSPFSGRSGAASQGRSSA